MDHHGFLGLTRQLNTALRQTHQVRLGLQPKWEWHATPVFYPESRCPFCLSVIRSNGIWFLRGPLLIHLVGMVVIEQGKKLELIQPSHPHDTGGGNLCLGRNKSGIELLASTPNLGDTPMGGHRIPHWLKRYWNRHTCRQEREYIQRYEGTENSSLERALDAI